MKKYNQAAGGRTWITAGRRLPWSLETRLTTRFRSGRRAQYPGGPRRNGRAQVLRADGTAIPGLYSAGELGSIYGMLYPAGGAISPSASLLAGSREQASEHLPCNISGQMSKGLHVSEEAHIPRFDVERVTSIERKSGDMKKRNPVKITDVTFRDGQQSLIATRMQTKEMEGIAAEVDKVGFYSLEVWGGLLSMSPSDFSMKIPGKG